MKFLVFLLLFSSSAFACKADQYWKGHNDIFKIVCEDVGKNDCGMALGKVRDGWARVLACGTLYYLKKEEKWIIVAKGPRFDIPMWEELGIPSGIR